MRDNISHISKKIVSGVLIISWILFGVGNIQILFADVGDIGHWRDSVGSQIPGTNFGSFNFDSEIRNDGIYSRPDNATIQLNEAGDYLIIATTNDLDTSNGRYNPQLRVVQSLGSGQVFSSHYSGFSRNNTEDQAWTRAVGIVIGASIGSQVQVQKRRDSDAPTGGSIVNLSDVQVVRINKTNYGLYEIGGLVNAYGGIIPNTVDIESVVAESDTNSIEADIVNETVTLKGDNKKYLTAWSVSFNGSSNQRTQRVGHLEYDNNDALSTKSYCYMRNDNNQYCGLGSMDLYQTNTTDTTLKVEVYRGDGVGADQGGADSDGTLITDGNGQMIVLEMPDSLEAFRSEDSVGLQDINTSQTLNIARDVSFTDTPSYSKLSDSQIQVNTDSDTFSWSNIWTARNNIASGVRQTSYGSVVVSGVEQTTGRHGSYSRGNQGSTDTFAMSYHPAGIYATPLGTTLGVNSDPIPGGGNGGTDRTQPGTLGFFALNLSTLATIELNQNGYRLFTNTDSTDVGAPLAAQNTSVILLDTNQDFRLRLLLGVSEKDLLQNEKTFKLQFAEKSGSCDAGFVGETYSDVTASSAIAYRNNATPNDNDALTVNAQDPVNIGRTKRVQTYQELNNFSNSSSQVNVGEDGIWDFSLFHNTASYETSYCFRVVESDNTLLQTYTNIPEITTAALPPISPGGIFNKLRLWLKGDSGTSTTINGAAVNTWSDSGPNGLDATQVGGNAPSYSDDSNPTTNFNPSVDFDGVNDYMSNLGGGAFSDTYYLVIVPDTDIEGTSEGGVPFGFECNDANFDQVGQNCGLNFGGLTLGAFTLTIPDEVVTHAIGSSANYRSSKTATITYPQNKPMLIGVNDDSATAISKIYESGVRIDNTTRNTYQTLNNIDYSLGRSLNDGFPFYYDGKIAEVINYDDGHSDTERGKIESYLAIKYGMTLGNGDIDYIDANSNILWNAGINTAYKNNIFGIGRDDVQDLSQVKSHSVNTESILIVEADGEGTNISPSFNDISNGEFMMISDNAAPENWIASNIPSGFVRVDRLWKVNETGDVGDITLSFDVDQTEFNVPVLQNGSSYYLIYDSDVDGDLSDETPLAMTNTSLNTWSISGINMVDGAIFTLASEASLNNIPTDISLTPTTINENISASSAIGTFSTIDADTGDTHSYTMVPGIGDNDNDRFSIVSNTLIISHSPDHEIQNSYSIRVATNDGNGGVYEKNIVITVNDIGETITSIIDLEDSEDTDKYRIVSGNWIVGTSNPFEGSFALESDNPAGDFTQSCFEVDHNSSATGSVSFYYATSTEANNDSLQFFIDGNLQTSSWSGTTPYTLYTSPDQAPGLHTYRWCYEKTVAGTAGDDTVYIDRISFENTAIDTEAPNINSVSIASGSLLPGGNHTLDFTYSDSGSTVDTGSVSIEFFKWNGSNWGSDISATALTQNSLTTSGVSYSTNDIPFGRYYYSFSVSDTVGNTTTETGIFYIDTPEILVSTGSIDIGSITSANTLFSSDDKLTVTVRTVGASFDVTMKQQNTLSAGLELIPNWDGTRGYGYRPSPYVGNLQTIGSTGVTLASQSQSINTNGDKNEYTYEIEFGVLLNNLGNISANDYISLSDFEVVFGY